MNFGQKMRYRFARFMQGRYGADQLCNLTLYLALGLTIADLFLKTGIVGAAGVALYVITIVRMLSRNRGKRAAENQRYLFLTANIRKKFRQFIQRQKNRKQYKYFKCPQCRALLRLTRGCGQVNVTCARCNHEFSQKA